MMQPAPTTSIEYFRPSKRRKFYRKKDASDDEAPADASPFSPDRPPSPSVLPMKKEPDLEDTKDPLVSENDDREEALPVAEILRQRRIGRRKIVGVEFSSAVHPPAESPASPSWELVKKEEDDLSPAIIEAMGGRFTAQTGRVAEETNKHMMDYIDREIAKRTQMLADQDQGSETQAKADGAPQAQNVDPRFRNPTSQGRLHEIDLGESAKLRNIVRTEAAVTGAPVDPPPPKKKPRVRIGRNGKPYIPKPRPDRNRRNSADIARDKMVEDLLRESRLDVYEDVQNEPLDGGESGAGQDIEGTADERMAERFRQEFLDAMSQRRERANKASNAISKPSKPGEERPKGPKLGGSRNQRAAMREKEEAAKAAATKGRR